MKRRIWLWMMGGILILGVGLFATVPIFNHLSGEQAWAAEQEQLRAAGHPMEIAEILPPPLPPGPAYFADHPWIAAQVKWREHKAGPFQVGGPEDGTVIYEDPELQSVLGRLDDEGQVNSLKDRIKLGLPAPVPRRTDFQTAAQLLQAEGDDPIAALLTWKKAHDPIFDELATAATRPAGYFPPMLDVDDPLDAYMPYYSVWVATARTITFRARLHLAAGQSQAAVREMGITFRLMDTLENEPSRLGFLLSQALLAMSYLVVWEGLELGAWTDADLIALEREFAARKPSAFLVKALDAQRLYFCRSMDHLLDEMDYAENRLLPFQWAGRIPHLKAYFSSLCREYARLVSARDWQGVRAFEEVYKKRKSKRRDLNRDLADKEWSGSAGLAGAGLAALRGEANLALTRVSMALERHYLRHGRFPETLAALDPAVTSTPILDPCSESGRPLHYELTPNGRYRLYSIGSNLVDDGGISVPVENAPDRASLTKGDIVWQFTGETVLPKRS